MSDRLRQWWRDLASAPAPLSRRERMVVVVTTVIAALSRFAAISLTPWDWDEMQFMSALRSFDVALHHPHPPGFPMFIAGAKLLTLAGLPSFRALQTINILGAMAILPAMFFLAREMRASFETAITAGGFLAFFPNVWFYGGTALSDVPSMVAIVVAAALLMRGSRSMPSLLGGALVLAIAAGFRPQNLAIGGAPLLVAAAHQIHRRRVASVVAAVALVVAITGISYGAVIHLSGGWEPFRRILSEHQEYITAVDSFRAPGRPALWRVFDDFFIRPYQAPLINAIVALLVIAGVIMALSARRPASLVMLVSFAPFCVFAWLFLDRFSVGRFSVGYAPLMALLAAEGLFAALPRRAAIAVATATIALMVVWTWPSLTVVRSTTSPPVAAIDAIRHQYPRGGARVDVQRTMLAFAQQMLPDYGQEIAADAAPVIAFGDQRRGPVVFLGEGIVGVPQARVFSRPVTPLWWLARQRYFDVSVVPLRIPAFGPGWYEVESDGARVWRWMGTRGSILLPPARWRGRLHLRLYVPVDAFAERAEVTVELDGRVLDRIVAKTAQIERTYVVPLRRTQPNALSIETNRVINPSRAGLSGDWRDLGVRLDALELQLEVEPERHPDLDAFAVLHRR